MSDFIYVPDYAVDETVSYKTIVSEFENGAEQRRKKWSNPQRKWSLRFRNRKKSEVDAVKVFFTGRLGSLTAFTWTNPNDSVEYTVRFADDSFKFSLKDYDLYDFEFDFIEVK
jgi:phage-related protein